MPWRFIRTIAVLVILMIFVMLNTQNACDLNFGFKVLPHVPVYLTVFFSFVLGLLSSLPFFILGILKKRPAKEKQPGTKNDVKEKQAVTQVSPQVGTQGSPQVSPKGRLKGRSKSRPQETPQENSPYGID